jgi:nucleotide-binding universal stress UspA family protein
MGSHGANGFKEMFIGSNAEKVVRNSEIPVLLSKRPTNFNVNKFVFASDFSDEIKKPFEKVVEFANKFDAELHVVMINTPSSFKPTHFSEEIMDKFVGGFNQINYLNIFITM